MPEDDFACAYDVAIAPGDHRSSEQWARDLWEGAPAPLRWFMVVGWRVVLGLRLGPRPSPEHILGWRIVERRPEETVCRLESRLLTARNTFRAADGRLTWSTYVSYRRTPARLIWPPLSLVHRALVRDRLRRAADRG